MIQDSSRSMSSKHDDGKPITFDRSIDRFSITRAKQSIALPVRRLVPKMLRIKTDGNGNHERRICTIDVSDPYRR